MAGGKIAIVENLGGTLGRYCYNRIALHFEPDFECYELYAKDGFPADVKSWADELDVVAVLVDGSTRSPLCPDRWIRDEAEFIRRVFELRMPFLGICFGHENLASALGGKLKKDGRLRVGLDQVKILKADPLFKGFNGSVALAVSHSVSVAAMPLAFERIAFSEKCEFMAVRHVDFPCYGVQFHPEMDAEIKVHDPVWRVMTDQELDPANGSHILRNFRDIVKKAAAGIGHRERLKRENQKRFSPKAQKV